MGKTSRERLILTLNHQDPGRVVMDLGATPITGININALARLRDALGLDKHVLKMNEPLQLLGEIEDDLRKALGVDVVGVSDDMTLFGFENTGWKDWTMQSGLPVLVPGDFNTTIDEKGTTYIYPKGDLTVPPSGMMPKGGYYFDNITRGESDFGEDDASAREDFKDDFGLWSDEALRRLEKKVTKLYNDTSYGLIGGGALCGFGDFASIPGPGVKCPKGVRDLADFMMAHIIMPEYVTELFDMQLEVGLKNARLIYQAVGNKLQAMQISGTDFGVQRGPYMALSAYREFYKPRHKCINDWIHQNTGWKTFYHSCGSVAAFLPDFYEIGVDILNPVQTTAADMDARGLKENWGDKFVFWGGGINTQQTLPFGTPEEVYNEAIDRLSIFAPGGGFVFNAVHNIQGQTPTENLVALFQAIKDYNARQDNGEVRA
ncbi:MAG: uroporphyrinogen decarboxylase family protein [Clostridia bacterium]